jgi:putative addiction module killer protein
MVYSCQVIEVRTTGVFDKWLGRLRDRQVRIRIMARIDRLSLGNPGQHRVLAGGLHEMKIDHGPGYRIYYAHHGDAVIILLCGGDKRTQRKDIELAAGMKQSLET